MACRRLISETISQFVKQKDVYHELMLVSTKSQPTDAKTPRLQWSPTKREISELLPAIPTLDFNRDFVQQVRFLPAVGKDAAKVEFQLEPKAFAEDILVTQRKIQPAEKLEQHVVFEFSSPNIAKPFHVGHLRSTIIGNVLGNLHQQLGYKVTKLNYLGDWGTQFGMLLVGIELAVITEKQMQQKPIESLYRAYVAANEAAQTDPTIMERARRYFTELETGANSEVERQWQQYRGYTVVDLKQSYARLGVHFDEYNWESQYSQRHIRDVLRNLHQRSLLLDSEDGRKVVQVDDRMVPIIKSDGSTLYLARDIAALLDRYERFNFERIFYVVDNAQTDHFNACFKTTAALREDISLDKLKHVKFGRVHGMSTRRGTAIFLRDVLDEARDIMLEKQRNASTTKVTLTAEDSDFEDVADVLGVSAVIVNDLKQRRQRDYDFDWQKVLQVNGDTGIKLQYTHCRLNSLLENVSEISVDGIRPDMDFLAEPEAQNLLFVIARFEQTIWLAKEQLEPCVLVNYLFSLCNAASRALKCLNVKNESCRSTQQNRIILFSAAKCTLKEGMKILGLRPLDKM